MNPQEIANQVLQKLNLKLDQSDPLLQFVLVQSEILAQTNNTLSKADGLKKSNEQLLKTIDTLLLKPKEKLEDMATELDLEIGQMEGEIAKLAELRNEFAKARFAPASLSLMLLPFFLPWSCLQLDFGCMTKKMSMRQNFIA